MKDWATEVLSCPLCKGQKIRPAFDKFNYSYLECRSCRSLFVDPVPSSEELERFYKDPDVNKLSRTCWNEVGESHRHVWGTWSEILDNIERATGKGPILDIGCGTGQFLRFASDRGWSRLEGIELVPEVAELARSMSGATIYNSTLLKADLPPDSYAGIILWDIVEHLNDIDNVLKEVFRLLRPGGIVAIGTVNRQGLSLRFLGSKALTVNPPEHILFFTASGMRSILRSTGFTDKKITSFSIYLLEWVTIFSKFFPARKIKDRPRKVNRESLTESKLFLILMKIANAFLSVTNLGDELITIGIKK